MLNFELNQTGFYSVCLTTLMAIETKKIKSQSHQYGYDRAGDKFTAVPVAYRCKTEMSGAISRNSTTMASALMVG